ncbi:tachylectin-related carbohydrate-binding protein [Lentzea xinjiangensis]|nr:tachylectin-related carbohydrate-binding protein [Lentzea xinjiangensis]
MRTYSRRALAALTAVAASTIVPIGATTARAAETLRCDSSVTMFASLADGQFRKYQHDEPENGSRMRPGADAIGGGWNMLWFTGTGGNVYQVLSTGNLHRFHWNGTTWDRFPPNNEGWSEKIAEGWDPNLSQNKVTVDKRGDFYKINANGDITWERYENGAWEKRILETGAPERYDSIFAAGDGVFFVRDPQADGQLYRYEYDSDSQRWIERKRYVNGGNGANSNRQYFSAGGDIFYGVEPRDGLDGFLWWYRFDKETGSLKPRVLVDTGIPTGMRWSAITNTCELLGTPEPTRPVVPQRLNQPSVAVEVNKRMSFFYVNPNGGLTVAKQRNDGDREILDFTTMPDHQRFTGSPAVAVRQDGRIEAVANSSEDAEVRGHLQAEAGGLWPSKALRHGGWMAGDPVIVAGANNVSSMFSIDVNGALWRRTGARANDGFMPWVKVGGTGIPKHDFTVVRRGADFEIVARFADGAVKAAKITNELGAWRTVGDGAVGKPAVVSHLRDGELQVYVRRADGKIYTKRETGTSFPAAWSPVGDFVAAGAPAAVLTGRDIVELAVRGTDDFVYQTGQVAPGESGYRTWKIEKGPYETLVDPTASLLPDGSFTIHWRTPNGELIALYGTGGQVESRVFTGGVAKR